MVDILKVTDVTAEVDHPIDIPGDEGLILRLDQGCKQRQVLHLFRLQAVLLHETGQVAVRVEDVAVLVGLEEGAVAQRLEQRQGLLR